MGAGVGMTTIQTSWGDKPGLLPIPVMRRGSSMSSVTLTFNYVLLLWSHYKNKSTKFIIEMLPSGCISFTYMRRLGLEFLTKPYVDRPNILFFSLLW